MDKVVETSVDNSGLWISRDLSTAIPQENAIYPQFCAQPQRLVLAYLRAFQILSTVYTGHIITIILII